MVENVWKCDSFGTKLFQLQMPKIVSHFSWILEKKTQTWSVEEELHLQVGVQDCNEVCKSI
jgi:hypothetical protein